MTVKSAVNRLCEAIGYPDPVPEGAASFQLEVDNAEVMARILGKRLVLSKVIDRNEADLPRLASFAPGRMLVEDAVLAWDERAAACVLWQELPDDADASHLVGFFENFMSSSDWWMARATELGAPTPVFPDIMIRP